MKHLLLASAFAALGLCAAEINPVLKVDFTTGKAVVSGSVKAACQIKGGVKFSKEPDAGIILDGKNGCVELPGTENISILNGATLYAVVRFDDNGTKNGEADAHDMVIFKDKEFLLGRSSRFLYFGNIKKDGMIVMYPTLILKKWTTIAAVITKLPDGQYTVAIYNKGRVISTKTFPASAAVPAGKAMITLGRGWGGCWHMRGGIAEIQIFDKPLTPAQLRELDNEAENID